MAASDTAVNRHWEPPPATDSRRTGKGRALPGHGPYTSTETARPAAVPGDTRECDSTPGSVCPGHGLALQPNTSPMRRIWTPLRQRTTGSPEELVALQVLEIHPGRSR